MDRPILLAAVIGASGLKGAVKVKLFAAAPLTSYGALKDKDGRSFSITGCRPGKAGEAVISLSGITTREAAEALKGTELFVAREKLPKAGDEEFYHADLVGLEAQDGEGRVIGKIAALHNYGAGDIVEITRPDGDSVLLSFTRETVPVIDIPGGRVVVAVPEEDETTNVE